MRTATRRMGSRWSLRGSERATKADAALIARLGGRACRKVGQ